VIVRFVNVGETVTSKQWWLTISPLSTKRTVTSKQWWLTI
jgi:hypothetical protein